LLVTHDDALADVVADRQLALDSHDGQEHALTRV
jgi:hypothetical protein